jgi:amidase
LLLGQQLFDGYRARAQSAQPHTVGGWLLSQLQGQAYTNALTGDAKGLRIGIVTEGFDWPGASQPEVDRLVRQNTLRLKEVGAEVCDVSIPMHREAGHIAFIYADGALALMTHGHGLGTNWQGHYLTQLQDFFGSSRRTRANDFSPTVKLVMLMGQYLHDSPHPSMAL